MAEKPYLTIAGGGIGGLTAALCLSKVGIRTRVLERAASPQHAGAGIQITPNAGAVLAQLGLGNGLADKASSPDGMVVRNWRGTSIIRVPFGRRYTRRFGSPYRTIHRADLLALLLDACSQDANIELLQGHSVVEFALHPRGLTVMADCDGRHQEHSADGLIGADGINSFVRSVVPAARPKVVTGRSAWRAVIAAEAVPKSLVRDNVGLWLGPNGHVVHYPVRNGKEFNVVVVAPTQRATSKSSFDTIQTRLRRWAGPVQDLLQLDADWQEWPIGTVRPSGPWAADRVALLGDAAHAMTPYLAQGGAMAIEDAAVLAYCVSRQPDDLAGAFSLYERERKPRVTRIWRAAAGAADLYHMGAVTGGMRNVAMRVLGGSGVAWRYRWIYRWQPPKLTEAPRNDGASG